MESGVLVLAKKFLMAFLNSLVEKRQTHKNAIAKKLPTY
jgi:hypothetical protein